MIEIKNAEQLSNIRVAGSIIKHIAATLPDMLRAGMATKEIDLYVHQAIIKEGGVPSFLGYRGFSASCCVSINDEIIHGTPSEKRRISGGDAVSVDIGVSYSGGFADSAHTFYVPHADESSAKKYQEAPAELRRLLDATKRALSAGIAAARAGNRISDIARAVYAVAQKEKLGVLREYCGHGVGNAVHEEPEIPNYYPFRGPNPRLTPGMVIAIEPMFALGTADIIHAADKFTVKTADGSLSAHFEHTVAITESGCDILT